MALIRQAYLATLRRGAAALIAAGALAGFASASATEMVSGSAVPSFGYVSIAGPVVPSPGTWTYSFQLSRPAIGQFTLYGLWTFDYYEYGTGMNVGGDDIPIEPQAYYGTPVDEGSLDIELFRPYTRYFFDYYERGSFSSLGAVLELYDIGIDPIEYTISAVLTAPPVPEPAVWMTMTLAFGAVGGAMRCRRKVPALA